MQCVHVMNMNVIFVDVKVILGALRVPNSFYNVMCLVLIGLTVVSLSLTSILIS